MQACDVIFSYGTLAPITLTSGYNYSDAKTPAVTSVMPKVGVTSGGDSLTITGADFGWVSELFLKKMWISDPRYMQICEY